MTVSMTNALAAYARQAKETNGGGLEARSADPGKSFADLVGESLSSAVESGRQSEQMSAQAIAGKADLNEVVSAVSNAEITLQTVIAIRDRMIQAYKEISQMPI
jgi:flagellar hook-basal body complex protein FliE